MISKGFLDDFVSKDPEPSYEENIMFFFLEKGIGFEEFRGLPLPYILGMLWVNSEQVKKQDKETKKNSKKGF